MSAQRWERIAAERGTRMDELQARAEAAEARCARLEQALQAIAKARFAVSAEDHREVARKALAGLDTPAEDKS